MKKTESYDFLILLTFLLFIFFSSGCIKPEAAINAEWKTPKEECIECHSKDPNFKAVQMQKHSEIHCLECHEISREHHKNRKNSFTDAKMNLDIKEGKCLLCHPTDRYSNAGHWSHLGTRASVDSRPMKCTDCHTNGHDLSKISDCSACHAEVYEKSQAMAVGHCTICHGFVRTSWMSESVEVHAYDPDICSGCHDLSEEASESDKESFKEALFDPHILKTSCAVCHSPHQKEDPGEELTCKRCHDQSELDSVVTHKIKAHMSFGCTKCHEPHNFKLTAGAECKECHTDFKAKVYDTEISGHKDCVSCHANNVYSKDIKNSCVKCHESQQKAISSAPEKHRDCKACHKPHEWENPTISICSKCHAGIVKQSAQVSSKSDCQLCHDSHSASKPEMSSACITCHSELKSGLHKQHIDVGCDSCHKAHIWIARDRAICLACHVDYKDHMDSSMLCNDCHWNDLKKGDSSE